MARTLKSPMTAALEPEVPVAEQTFFDDPAIDRLMGVVMNLATEVFVMRERCAALEAQLADSGAIDLSLLNAEPDASLPNPRVADQQAFVAHLLEPLRGQQVSRPASQ